mmetsp:Transcript_44140/g.104466  ORF Transcript_44140/g.104466 Transcript_44140/m.104466 type:complete len:306 (-) Transcript_44140:148-1065(-)
MRLLSLILVTVVVAAIAAVAAFNAGPKLLGSSGVISGGSLHGVLLVIGVCCVVIAPQYAFRLLPRASSGSRIARLGLPRRLQHCATGLLITLLYARILPLPAAIVCLAASTAAFAAVQAARTRSPSTNKQFLAAFGGLLREHERAGAPPAALYFLAGALLVVVLLPQRLCTFALLSVSLGDPTAAITGQLLGGPRILGEKTLSGFLGCSVACGACAAAIARASTLDGSQPLGALSLCILAAVAGLAAASAELLGGRVPGMDDNLVMPIGAGLLVKITQVGAAALAAWGLQLAQPLAEALAALTVA